MIGRLCTFRIIARQLSRKSDQGALLAGQTVVTPLYCASALARVAL